MTIKNEFIDFTICYIIAFSNNRWQLSSRFPYLKNLIPVHLVVIFKYALSYGLFNININNNIVLLLLFNERKI